MKSLRQWAKAQLKAIAKIDCDCDKLRAVVAEGQEIAARSGLLEAAIACQGIRLRPRVEHVGRVLNVCIETTDVTPLTVRQAAKHAGASPDIVREWIKTGAIEATQFNVFGRHPRHAIAPDALVKFMAKRRSR